MSAAEIPDGNDGAGMRCRWMIAATLDDSDDTGRQRSWTIATMFDAEDTKQQQRRTAVTPQNGHIDSSNLLAKHSK